MRKSHPLSLTAALLVAMIALPLGATDSWTMNMDSGTAGKMTSFARTTLTRATGK